MLLELLDVVLELELDDEATLDLDEELMFELELIMELETLEEDETLVSELELPFPIASDEFDTAVPPPLHAEIAIAALR